MATNERKKAGKRTFVSWAILSYERMGEAAAVVSTSSCGEIPQVYAEEEEENLFHRRKLEHDFPSLLSKLKSNGRNGGGGGGGKEERCLCGPVLPEFETLKCRRQCIKETISA